MSSTQGLALLGVFVGVLVWGIQRLRRRSIRHLRGPDYGWLMGNALDINLQDQAGDVDFKWLKEYGSAWRMGGPLGDDVLMVADPKALQHILHKSGYHYPKRQDGRVFAEMITGRGIVWASSDEHPRHRKIMNPAFTTPQLRSFLTLFQNSAAKMCGMLESELVGKPDEVIKFNDWLMRTTLDIIGESAFDYDYGALEDEENEVSKAFKNMFAESVLYPSKFTIIFRTLWLYVPYSIARLVNYLPFGEYKRFRHTMTVVNKVSKGLIAEKTKAFQAGEDFSGRDVMSVLANLSENPSTRLNAEEMAAQMATLTLAGHDTTANTLTWLFWELAKVPEYQEKMRAEVAEFRKVVVDRGDDNFGIDDLNAMKYCLAAIKETLRMHPIVYQLIRAAGRDDVIPLAYPIVDKNGNTVSSIPVSAGQGIMISICSYQRMKEVWGEDADTWNAERWFDLDLKKMINVGPFSNLVSFSGGIRACIGWQFSLIEMQALVATLLESFKFELPPDKPEIVRMPSGLMGPMVRGKFHEGFAMPLKVTPLKK